MESEGEREGGEREKGREREREVVVYRKVCEFGVVVFFTYFVSCNGPCAPKVKWHRKEHIIIIKPSLVANRPPV